MCRVSLRVAACRCAPPATFGSSEVEMLNFGQRLEMAISQWTQVATHQMLHDRPENVHKRTGLGSKLNVAVIFTKGRGATVWRHRKRYFTNGSLY